GLATPTWELLLNNLFQNVNEYDMLFNSSIFRTPYPGALRRGFKRSIQRWAMGTATNDRFNDTGEVE
ncbi:MAG: hypothetical protein V3S89_14625, partial [Desulfobacterales bacterium]